MTIATPRPPAATAGVPPGRHCRASWGAFRKVRGTAKIGVDAQRALLVDGAPNLGLRELPVFRTQFGRLLRTFVISSAVNRGSGSTAPAASALAMPAVWKLAMTMSRACSSLNS